VRVVDNVRAIRPDLLVHSREPGGARMLIEVKSIAFGMSRYSTRCHMDGATYMDGAPRGRGSEGKGRAAAAAIDAEVFAGVVPPPMQTQIQRMGGMSSAVRGDWRVLRAQPRQRLTTGAWRDFHEIKIARLPYVDPSTEYARALASASSIQRRFRDLAAGGSPPCWQISDHVVGRAALTTHDSRRPSG
jgi:hypothetical protein